MLSPAKLVLRLSVALLILAAVMAVCLLVGSQNISLERALRGPTIDGVANIDYVILMQERLPRVFLASIVSGAGLGAIIAILFSGTALFGWIAAYFAWLPAIPGVSSITLMAFVGAMLTVWLVWGIGQATGRQHGAGLLLAGVVVNAFFSALIMFLSSIARANQLQTTMIWLMGNMNVPGNMLVLWVSGGIVLGGVTALLLLSNRLNILSFGSADAQSLGVPIKQTCFLVFACAALITSVAVSLSGLIGFVGLVVPHAVRLVAGPDHRQLIPLSAIIGAAFLVAADAVARVVVAPAMLPVGVVTALVGGPFFLVLLIRYTKNIHWGRG
ncbi:MAG: FecCD family ABC transporter permease [Planctomycetota bacterium]|jgi:iron complex transport system permease protein